MRERKIKKPSASLQAYLHGEQRSDPPEEYKRKSEAEAEAC
jgi:hypothetical protein